MWIIGYLLALAIGGTSLGVGISMLSSSEQMAFGFIAFGIATILATVVVFISKRPWELGLRASGSSSTGVTAEVFVIFAELRDWETVVVIAIYVVSFVVTYLIGNLA